MAAWGCTVGAATVGGVGAVRRVLAAAGAVALPRGLGAGPPAGPCAGTAGRGVAAARDATARRGMVCEVGAYGAAVWGETVRVAGTGVGAGLRTDFGVAGTGVGAGVRTDFGVAVAVGFAEGASTCRLAAGDGSPALCGVADGEDVAAA